MKNINPRYFICIFSLALVFSCSSVEKQKDYSAVVSKLKAAINYEMEDKNLPAFGVVLVEGSKTIWTNNIGFENPNMDKVADENTIYRIGSVSKLFTDIGIMQLVEKGEIDLDVPVSTYLPDFIPDNISGTPITLRQLMSHKSGLIREPKVGNYFDESSPTLEATVGSLNGTPLIYKPETKTKYSNAGIAVVGRVIEKTQGIPFTDYLKTNVLDPIGLKNSAFVPTKFVDEHLAYGEMWSYDGRIFPAPKFELGMAPAGSMYATMNDLGKFIKFLFGNGAGENGQVLDKETLALMWEPQFEMDNYGLGFNLTKSGDFLQVGHGGAIYGFSTQLSAIPELKLGIATVSTADITNSISSRIANYGLSLIKALKNGQELPIYEQFDAITMQEAGTMIGRYKSNSEKVSVEWLNNELVLIRGSAESRIKISQNERSFVLDGRLGSGRKLEFDEIGFDLGSNRFEKYMSEAPEENQDLSEFIGEYGWDHNVLFIYEKQKQLHSLIEWAFKYPLMEVSDDLFAFPNEGGLYHGENLKFIRDESGQITGVEIENSVFFPKRKTADANETFRIEPLKPIEELREIALKSTPPEEANKLEADLIEPSLLDNSILLDIRYASTNNFMSNKFYEQARAFMQRPAAKALVEASGKLKYHGVGLLIHDAYRPWYVTKMFWDATSQDLKIFVANPENGSRHNRGCAVDITLYNLKTGEPIEMVGGYDEMSERSYPNYMGGSSKQRWYRRLLRETMESVGFTVYQFEWWHFDYKTWNEYSILNIRFEDM